MGALGSGSEGLSENICMPFILSLKGTSNKKEREAGGDVLDVFYFSFVSGGG